MSLVFAATSAAIALPWLHFAPKSNSTRSFVHVFLLLHTLFILYSIIFSPPTNIFTQLRIPLATPIEALRRHFLQDIEDVPKSLDRFLTRMGSFETRTLYVRYALSKSRRVPSNSLYTTRFGHDVVVHCEHCLSYTDFAIYATPGLLLTYIRQAAIIGVRW